jgi:hypothetical protein
MKIHEVTITAEEMQRIIAPRLQQRLLTGGMRTGLPFTAILAVTLSLAGEVSVRRAPNGSYIFTQRISEQVTDGAKSFKDEFAEQRTAALRNGVD